MRGELREIDVGVVDGGEEANGGTFDGVLLWEVDVDFPLAEFVGGIGGAWIGMGDTGKIDEEGGVVLASLHLFVGESKPVDILFLSLQRGNFFIHNFLTFQLIIIVLPCLIHPHHYFYLYFSPHFFPTPPNSHTPITTAIFPENMPFSDCERTQGEFTFWQSIN